MQKGLEKKDIRKEVLSRRKEATEEFLKEASERICSNVEQLAEFQKADCVYVYMDCKHEVQTGGLIAACRKLGKRVAAPKVFGEDMKYYYINTMEDIAPGYFQVPEPDISRNLTEAKEEEALLIVPGVAFDRKRHRCGYGKGFYDRYLSRHQKHVTVAVAFEFQLMDEVPSDSFDIPPAKLVTEAAVYE